MCGGVGVTEEKILKRSDREAMEKERTQYINDCCRRGKSGDELVEERHRIRKFEERKERPLKIKFATRDTQK